MAEVDYVIKEANLVFTGLNYRMTGLNYRIIEANLVLTATNYAKIHVNPDRVHGNYESSDRIISLSLVAHQSKAITISQSFATIGKTFITAT